MVGVWWEPHSGLQVASVSLCPHRAKKRVSGVSFRAALTFLRAAPL